MFWYDGPVHQESITAVGDEVSLRWDLNAVVGDQFQALWDIRAGIGDTVQFLWDLRAALGDSVQLFWRIQDNAPIVLSVTQTAFASNSATWNVDLPATVTMGDTLLVLLASDSDDDFTATPTGWERLRSSANSTHVRLTGFAKIADGTEGGTQVQLTLENAQDGAAQVFRIINTSGKPVMPSFNPQNTASPNPFVTDPNWGERDVLFIIAVAVDGDVSATAASTNYGDIVNTESGAGDANGASMVTMRRTALNNNASEDPDALTLDATAQVGHSVIALRGPVKSDELGFFHSVGSASGQGVSTPDTAALDITGDMDVRALFFVEDRGGAVGAVGVTRHQNIITKGNPGDAAGSWVLRQAAGGTGFQFSWREAGGSVRTATSSSGLFTNGVYLWVRAVLDVDNGSGQYDVHFYTSTEDPELDPASVTWTLANTVTGSTGTSSISSGSSDVWLGNRSDDNSERLGGDIMYAEIRNGIGGTIVANPDFRTRDQFVGPWSLTDDSRTWTIHMPGRWFYPLEAAALTAIGDQVGFLWDVRTAVGKAIQTLWDIRAALGDTVQVLWDIRAALGDPVQFLWDDRAAIGDPIVFRWDQFTAIGDTVELRWDLRATVAKAIQALWDISGAVGDPLDLQWDVRAAIADTAQLLWDIYAALGDPLALVWDVTGAIGKAVQLLWDILRDYVYLSPTSTVANDGWESGPTTGQPLWQQVDEDTADDSDYIWIGV